MPDPEQNQKARRGWDGLVAHKIAADADSSVLIAQIAASLGEELNEILEPCMLQLINTANRISSGSINHDHRSNRSTFRHDLSQLIEASLRLKLDLTRSDSEHTFIWPGNGEALDTSRMQALNRPSNGQSHQVAYTLFPSIESKGHLGPRKVRHAEVVSVPQISPQTPRNAKPECQQLNSLGFCKQ